ncbi:MAG: glycosyltransferase family A protein [Dysgonomonas sp.]|nr:glycosyltransferase family A protein [Dysgonomonas sp.]
MSVPLVSIITPCYNDGNYILECIECVKNSTYDNIEHIIIDDGSTDKETVEILENLSRGNIHLIRTENQGVCKARQQAILDSSGKYILPLDADDLISRDYISLGVKELESDNDISLIVTDYKLFGQYNKTVKLEPYSLERLLGHNLFINTSLYRRTAFDRVGGYNENMKDGLEDWDFWINILKDGGKVKKIDGIHFFYRIKKKAYSRNANIDKKKHEILRRQIWENHREVFSQVFLNPLETFEYLRISTSKEYIIGRLLLKPLKKILRK